MVKKSLSIILLASTFIFAYNCAAERTDWLKQHHKCIAVFHKENAPQRQVSTGVYEINVSSSEYGWCLEKEKEAYGQYLGNGGCASYVPENLNIKFKKFVDACLFQSDMDACDKAIGDKKIDSQRDSDGNTLLLEAARELDFKSFEYFLSKGADINKVNHYGENALHVALSYKYDEEIQYWQGTIESSKEQAQLDIVNRILTAGVHPQKLTLSGKSALAIAVENRAPVSILKTLVEHGALVNFASAVDGEEPIDPALNIAVRNRYYNQIKFLLEKGANPNNSNFPIWEPLWGETIAQFVQNEKPSPDPLCDSITVLLLKHKANPDGYINLSSRNTSVFVVAYEIVASKEVIEAFYKANVDIAKCVLEGEPWEPIVTIIKRNDVFLMKKFLKKKYDVNKVIAHTDGGRGVSALEVAILEEKEEMVDLLIKAKADVNKVMKDPVGSESTPLLMAIGRNKNITQKLIKSGANVNQVSIFKESSEAKGVKMTPLLYAAVKEEIETVEMLIKANANVNFNPLSEPSSILDVVESAEQTSARKQIVAMLKKAGATKPFRGSFVRYCADEVVTEKMAVDAIKNGADVNETDDDGFTPLHMLAYYGKDPKALNVLIKKGAFVNATTKEGTTPLILAAMHNSNPAILKILIAAGADLEAKNSDNHGILTLAIAYNESPAVVSFLLQTSLGDDLDDENKNILLNNAVRINPNPKVLIALFKAGFSAEPPYSWMTKPLHVALEKGRSPETIKILIQGKAVVDSRAMELARNLPMDTDQEKKNRNQIIDILTKAKKKAR